MVLSDTGKTAGLPRPGMGRAAVPSAAECAAFCDEVGERLLMLDFAGIAGSVALFQDGMPPVSG